MIDKENLSNHKLM